MGVRATLDSASPHAIDTKQIKSDKTLLASIAKGSADALRTLFARHQTAVHRFVLQLTSNPSIAEEVVSDVFLEVWRSARNFEGKSQVSTWLLAIARYKSIATLRKRNELQLDERFASTIEDSRDDPEESLVKQEHGSIIHSCLSQLTPAHRQIIDLVYWHGKSVSEVVDLIGIPPSTVKTRMFYARNRMAQLLEQADIVDAMM